MRYPLRFPIRAVAIMLATTLVVVAPASRAQGKPAPGERASAEAMDLFEQSEVAYQQGRFADALSLLRRSYVLKKEPVLLYNMGRAYDGLGELEAAAKAYAQFLADEPSTPDRRAIEQRIATLQRQIGEREELRRRALEKEARPRPASPWPWLVASVGGAGLAAGGVLGVLARGRNDDAVDAPSYREAASLHDEATSMAFAANVCILAGGAVLLGGLVWGIIDLSTRGGASRRALVLPTLWAF